MTQEFYFKLMREKKASLLNKINVALATSQPVIGEDKAVVAVQAK